MGMQEARDFKNRNTFITEKPDNYKNTIFRGKTYDNINSTNKKILCFPIYQDTVIQNEDIVLINEYCEAFSLRDLSTMEYPEYCEVVGRSIITMNTDEERSQKVVLVEGETVMLLHNSCEEEDIVTE